MICKCGHPRNNHFDFGPKKCAHCDCMKLTPTYSESEQNLRTLRMWHWEQVLQATSIQNNRLSSPRKVAAAREAWKLHMGAVQCLNDYLPDTTAEQDYTKQEKLKCHGG